ncbi:MAG: hypothetical protein NC311_19405 [Muribaculaceae bacterium]|nr:hypothetical protein [Muribaculaceae bacterium]
MTMEKISRIISAIFSPLLIPTYAMAVALWTTILFVVSTSTKIGVLSTTFVVTCLVPLIVIFILYKLKIVSDSGLNKQNERLIPYGVTALCYFALAYYLRSIHSPAWLYMFVVGGGIATVASAIINLKWKISAHGAAAGGLVAFIFSIMYIQVNILNMNLLFFAAIAIAGIVGTTRLVLERHTLTQVLAGIANGVICVSASIFLTC